MIVVVLALLWVICGAVAYALCLGSFYEFRTVRRSPNLLAWTAAVLGPIGLIAELLSRRGSYRLRWRGWGDEHWSDYVKQQYASGRWR